MNSQDLKHIKQIKTALETTLTANKVTGFQVKKYRNGKFVVEIEGKVAVATCMKDGFVFKHNETEKTFKVAKQKAVTKEQVTAMESFVVTDENSEISFRQSGKSVPKAKPVQPAEVKQLAVANTLEELAEQDEEIRPEVLEANREMMTITNPKPEELRVGMKLLVAEEDNKEITIKDEEDLELITMHINEDLYHYTIVVEEKKVKSPNKKQIELKDGQEFFILDDNNDIQDCKYDGFKAINSVIFLTREEAAVAQMNKRFKVNSAVEAVYTSEEHRVAMQEKYPMFKFMYRINGSVLQFKQMIEAQEDGVVFMKRSEKELIKDIHNRNNEKNKVVIKKSGSSSSKQKLPMVIEELDAAVKTDRDSKYDALVLGTNVALYNQVSKEYTLLPFKTPFANMNSGIRKMQIDRIKKTLDKDTIIANEDYIFGITK